ncbi:MAG: bifunctional 23S rRNA (guanine(2069)-N(7))-methyltransferase RlmK/23S rRNA (guanine(2445)-N(2))-methyltransferase RlmL [Deltaproteobacteria bacterium]|nr:MAG: bifunctional 23S rRNA (guanine(2069)-N(7))-methyltransferase RlmK/23S rRNA (guanine(2445)-N(2))-methyltransferase RlmL [Deltaproteobacteria bacterium]
MKKQIYKLTAACPAGVEGLAAEEISSFGGAVIKTSRGLVRWHGTLEAAYRACLWSRFSSSVLLQITGFSAPDEGRLYHETLAFNWEKHLDPAATFAVGCTLAAGSAINHSKFAALRVKDGVADYFRNKCGRRPSVKPQQPDVQLRLHIDSKNEASLFIDLSGESLHRRGYRRSGVAAPLKENLAAAIVFFAGWPQQEKNCLVDPMCGSGTLLIEAALAFGDIAPGLFRDYYGFIGWRQHNRRLWSQLVSEAEARKAAGESRAWPMILGYDADPEAVAAAGKNIAAAGLKGRVQVDHTALFALQKPDITGSRGLLLCNPPYGERLAEKQEAAQLYRAMGHILAERFSGWQAGILVAGPELTDNPHFDWQDKIALFNGAIACKLLLGRIGEGGRAEPFSWPVQISGIDQGMDLANRLGKNAKTILKWARRENISCFRIYDRDLPEFNFRVDMYDKWIQVQEFAPPKSIDVRLAKKRFNLGLSVIRSVFGAGRERIFIKTRSRQRGSGQYQKKGNRQKMYAVREGNCRFLVNFTDYLDTGLFLDHRPIRAKIAAISKGKRFLNLFAYTGTATVSACLGGAAATTTVDLSARYLDWAKMNLALNGIAGPSHQLVKTDCMAWLEQHWGKYDLIFVDPPTFSNTKKKRRIFDVQRDHLLLIRKAMARLEEHGLLIFSTNFRRFKLAEGLEKEFEVKEITSRTIPFDFKKNHHIHRCWEIRYQGRCEK